jgi:hypothetical protein
MNSAAVMPEIINLPGCLSSSLGIIIAASPSRKENGMTRTLDVITEIIRNPKHPFRKADDRPVKAQKHRYERRKIKEFIRLSDWGEEKIA